jgi:hypothetical protein
MNLDTSVQPDLNRPDSRRGLALILVMLAIGVSVVPGVTFLITQGVFSSIARNVHDHAAARCIAESAAHNLVAHLKRDDAWRSQVAEGQWVELASYLGGGATVHGYDGVDSNGDGIVEGDGQIGDDTSDPVTLAIAGTYGNATHNLTVVIYPGGDAPDFDIDEGTIVAREPVTAEVVSVGAAIANLPVTLRIHIGQTVIEPFGPFDSPTQANLNSGEQQDFQLPHVYPQESEFAVEARSWNKKRWWYSGRRDSHYEPRLTVNSADGTQQVKVLRDGDDVPDISGFGRQADVGEYLADFVDSDTGKIAIADHQALLLFELYTTNMSSWTADFQDLVIMVNLGRPGQEGDSGGGAGGGQTPTGFVVHWK